MNWRTVTEGESAFLVCLANLWAKLTNKVGLGHKFNQMLLIVTEQEIIK